MICSLQGAEFLMRSVLKVQSCLCTWKVKGCSELNWELVVELVFVILHTEFLLHWGFTVQLFLKSGHGMVVTVQLPKGVRHLQGLGEVHKDEDPLFCSNESLNPNSSIFCRVYCWREAQKVVHEGELHLQAAELLHRNWPGLCDVVARALHAAVSVFYILQQPLML